MQATIVAGHVDGAQVPAKLIAGAVEALGSPRFLPVLLEGLNALDDFPFLFAGREDNQCRRFEPCTGFRRASFETPAILPMRTIDADDPMRSAMYRALGQASVGSVFIGHVGIEELRNTQRRELIFERNGLATRIGASTRGADGTRYFLCLYRGQRRAERSDAYATAFNTATVVALALLRKHWQLQDAATADSGFPARLQDQAALTDREWQVCSALLRGRSLPKLAEMLGIRTSTARTYQQRAFARLGVRNRSELFALIHPQTVD